MSIITNLGFAAHSKGTDFSICQGGSGIDFLFKSQIITAACIINSTEDTLVLNSKTSFFTVMQKIRKVRSIVTWILANFNDKLFLLS